MKEPEKIRIFAPGAGACPVCAAKHGRDEPHDVSSLYYQNQFWKMYRRFPTADDAAAHLRENREKNC